MALPSETFQRVQTQSLTLGRYTRFLLIYEYSEKTVLPPPFNIFCYPVQFIRSVYLSYHGKRRLKPPRFAKESGKTTRTLGDFDDDCSILELLSEKEIATIYWKDYVPDEQKQMQNEVALKSLEKKSEFKLCFCI